MGVLLYIATHSRADMAVVMGVLARHVELPSLKHQITGVQGVNYLNYAKDLGLLLTTGTSNQLSTRADAK